MSNPNGPARDGPLDVVLLGRRCAMTARVLETLVSSDLRVRTVVLATSSLPNPNTSDGLPVISQPVDLSPIDRLAASSGIDVVSIHRADVDRLAQALSARRPDALLAACFPWKIPASVTAIPRLGGLNIHPSLLPRHRGPEPLFWTFHDGDREAGVTVHIIADKVDRGPMLLQRRIALTAGTRYQTLEDDLAVVGGWLAVQAIHGLHAGVLSMTPQSGSPGAWARMPRRDDLTITTDWSAERAFRFVAGVGDRFGPIAVSTPDGARIEVIDAIEWHPEGADRASATRPPGAVEIGLSGGSIVVRVREGVPVFQE